MPGSLSARAWTPTCWPARSGRSEIAASGLSDLGLAKEYAQTGVDHLYVESLSQHATALDMALVLA